MEGKVLSLKTGPSNCITAKLQGSLLTVRLCMDDKIFFSTCGFWFFSLTE